MTYSLPLFFGIFLSAQDVSSSLLLLLCLTAIGYYCFAIFAATEFFSQPIQSDPEFQPPVSILKPICGLDSGAYENLASFCRQDYPTYQVIFGVQDAHDSSLILVKQLVEDFPEVDIRIVISDRIVGTNLKVNNLANASVEAEYDILLLADSDIRVGTDYLKRVIQPLRDPKVGVVTCMYRSRTEGWIAAFEALSISTEFLPSVLVARKLEGMTFALGATIVIQKAVLEAIGDFPAIVNYLEDDFQLGHLPSQVGYEVVLSDYVVDHAMSTSSFLELLHHQTRWTRGTRFARPWGHAGLIFTYGTIASTLLCWVANGSWLSWVILAIVWSLRLAMAWIVGVINLRDSVARKLLWLLPLRDLISFLVWCHSFSGDTVEWRGRRLKLTKGGKLTELKPKMSL
jgi:ceramide glucosyltransferase